MTATARQTPRARIAWTVLEAAKANCDATVTAAARRIIVADRLGWKKHGETADLRLCEAFYDAAK